MKKEEHHEQPDHPLGRQVAVVTRDGALAGEVVTTATGFEARIGSKRITQASLDDALSGLLEGIQVDGDCDWVITCESRPAWKIAPRISGNASAVIINEGLWLSYGDDIAWVPESPEIEEDFVEGVWLSYQMSSEPGSPGGSPCFGVGVDGVGDLRRTSDYESGDPPEWFRVELPFSERDYFAGLGVPEDRYLESIQDPALRGMSDEEIGDYLGSPHDYEWTPITVNGVDFQSDGKGGWTRA